MRPGCSADDGHGEDSKAVVCMRPDSGIEAEASTVAGRGCHLRNTFR